VSTSRRVWSIRFVDTIRYGRPRRFAASPSNRSSDVRALSVIRAVLGR
jgi:hypothetical protein